MFTLSIAHDGGTTSSEHPNREVAIGALVAYIETTGQRLHVTGASWAHTRYQIMGGTRIVGYAVVEEICRCAHAAREHDETGCTTILIGSGRPTSCSCRQHQPVSGDPMLFPLPQ